MQEDNQKRQIILEAALEEIENLAAPRRIDTVSALVGMDMVEFASLGPDKMRAVILATLALARIAHGSGDVGSKKIMQQPDGSTDTDRRRPRH